MSTADDRARLDEIEREIMTSSQGFKLSDVRATMSCDEIEWLIPLARDGLRWREAAAVEGEVEAMNAAACRRDGMFRDIFNEDDRADIMSIALTAAAAWRTANAPKDDERDELQARANAQYSEIAGLKLTCDALRAQVEMLREALRPFAELAQYGDKHSPRALDSESGAISIGALRRAKAALAATEPKERP